MAAPTIPTKETGDTLSADEINNLAASVTALYNATILRGFLTQTGTYAPVFTILENSTGRTWTAGRDSEGVYYINPSGASINEDKCFCSVSNGQDPAGKDLVIGSFTGTDSLNVVTLRFVDGVPTYTDGILYYTSVELIIYP